MGKSLGFWFFTGDWLKDAELRFCSIFARGLLVDLLCILFEAKEQGYASKPDGTPRSDAELVDAVSGGTQAEKLAALRELENSGVLSRDSRGVLYSRRIARLAEISKERSKAGSKGGSKSKAKPKQNSKQSDQQKPGVSVSDSVSDIYTHTAVGHATDPAFASLFQKFINHSELTHNWTISEATSEQWLYKLADHSLEEATEALNYSIERGVKAPFSRGEWKQARLLSAQEPEPEPFEIRKPKPSTRVKGYVPGATT